MMHLKSTFVSQTQVREKPSLLNAHGK